jgi:hypothetical protein
MTDLSANLALPYLAASQAQKHVTHNEALQILDAVVQLCVLSRDQSDPPATPELGARYIVGPAAIAAWAGHEEQLALWAGTTWIFIAPQLGWRAWVADAGIEVVWSDDQWQAMPILDNLPGGGINAVADPTNRLVVSAAATLLNHDGAGHQLKVNKAAAGDTASLLFQTGFSGRAEMGLAGNDAWSIKVSANGSNWTEALTLNPATGHVTGAAISQNASDATAGRLLTVGAGGVLATDVPMNITNMDATPPGNGFARCLATALGTFPTGFGALPCVIVYTGISASDRYMRMMQSNMTGGEWLRHWNGSSWGGWKLISPEIVGTVSQVAGVPTGASIERGTNANGSYVRFADGTQICTRTVALGAVSSTSTVGGMYCADAILAPHAANFLAGSDVYASGGGSDLFLNGFTHGFAADPTNAIVRVARPANFTAVAAGTVKITSVGRWF